MTEEETEQLIKEIVDEVMEMLENKEPPDYTNWCMK